MALRTDKIILKMNNRRLEKSQHYQDINYSKNERTVSAGEDGGKSNTHTHTAYLPCSVSHSYTGKTVSESHNKPLIPRPRQETVGAFQTCLI